MTDSTPAGLKRMPPLLLQATPALGSAHDGAIIRVLPPRARFCLRLDPAALGVHRAVAGFALDIAINRCAANGRAERIALRLGPDEWQLLGRVEESEAIVREVEAALGGMHHSLVDVSHRQVAFAVSGPESANVVSAGCPLDLAAHVFAQGHATRTLLGRAEIILIRPDATASFEIECGRSFAGYVRDFLREAAREYRV